MLENRIQIFERHPGSVRTVSLAVVLFGMVCLLGVAFAQDSAGNMNHGVPWAYGFPGPVLVATSNVRAGNAAPEEQVLKHLPDTSLAFTSKQIDDAFGPADWYPSDHPIMPGIVAHGQKPEVRACGFCHYPNGKGRPNNAGVAGLPEYYIVQQLENFRNGNRRSWDERKTNTNQMIAIARGLTDDEMKAAARYFSSVKWSPWIKVVETETVPKTRFEGGGGGLQIPVVGPEAGTEPIGDRIVEVPANVDETALRDPRSGFIAYVPSGSIEKGKSLAMTGGGKTIACDTCHGDKLDGGGYAVPSLAGRSPSYMARQLYDFKMGTRTDYSRMMTRVVAHLNEDDILAIVAYVASLPPEQKITNRVSVSDLGK